jgi:hypothetical protein
MGFYVDDSDASDDLNGFEIEVLDIDPLNASDVEIARFRNLLKFEIFQKL